MKKYVQTNYNIGDRYYVHYSLMDYLSAYGQIYIYIYIIERNSKAILQRYLAYRHNMFFLCSVDLCNVKCIYFG